MPSLTDHQSSKFVKLFFIGNSGSGKTGALTSLVKAGYSLRILDLDNGLDALVNHVMAECKDKAANVSFETVRDDYVGSSTGPRIKGAPRAFVHAVQLLDKWTDGTSPKDWGEDTILVVDSLTELGRAAFAWARGMNPTAKEPRQWYKTAQDALEDVVAMLTSESFHTNVILISHIDFREEGGLTKGFVSSVGKSLGPKLPRFVNTLLLADTTGTGANVKRKIKTLPTAMIDLKNPAPMKIGAEYDLGIGLAEVFKTLKAH